jgi:beta-glucanase (GH16 family)
MDSSDICCPQYFNDTQEIDMEFLSREFQPELGIYPISLVIQSRESKEAGYDASKTGTYQRVNLTFDPTADFHEYRFDYLPGRVLFYADSAVLAVIQGEEVPSVGGHLILQHWSNGNPLWSGGPPASDAFLEISYVKAYFNSSDQVRLSNQSHKCHSFAPEVRDVCAIPDVTAAEAKTGGHFFTGPEGGEEDEDEPQSRSQEEEEEEEEEEEDDNAGSEESSAPVWLPRARARARMGMGMGMWLVVAVL